MQNSNAHITFIGGGNMGRALISGLLANGFEPNQISVVEANAARAPEHQRVFINNEGVALNFDDASIVNTKLLASNPEYQALLSTYPDCILGFNTRTPEIKKANDGGQFFDITYPLLNGCIACQHIGEAVLRFQFDAHGNYQNLSLMRVTSTV